MLSVLFPAVSIAAYIAITLFGLVPDSRGHDPLMGQGGSPTFFWMTTAATLIGVPSLFWRFDGSEKYRAGYALHKTARTRALQEGQQVTLVVDPEKPGRALCVSCLSAFAKPNA